MAIKGNLVVGQSGGPTTVINSSLLGVVRQAMAQPEIEGIYGMLHGIRGLLHGEFIDLRKESDETLDLLLQTPASALGTVRYKVKPSDYDSIVAVFERYNVRFFFYIGGNDSMDTTNKIHKLAVDRGYELHAFGVPKTVDNDLALTDHCPGFGSAARFVAASVRNTGYDTRAMGDSGPIKFVEVMGRNAGWLTASAILAKDAPNGAPHLIYVPEHPVSEKQVVADVKRCMDSFGYCVAAVSEGAKDSNGKEFGKSGPVEKDAFGHERKGGGIDYLAALVKEELGITVRLDKPGYLQRSFGETMSSVDREEAYQAGRTAVRMALAGDSGKMVTFVRRPGVPYAIDMQAAPLGEIANVEHKLPKEYINAEGNGVTEAFVEYVRPLIGEPLTPYGRLAMNLVRKA